ncbi:unnamed protein product [Zymoseptoria tritici ST99CH_3D1]|uniref:Major facilitator superfamily (MFS) profile domain-containing protein n=2 Tax=Zymoseptoria tritici TaxID=1047171 RepID=F9X001_ZYMTI|nr:uncharacterized protein MYCGRDRAFT_65725 [Zymoseptoria tritici IPO323]EGP91145.1 hypothetical protein MYCGRDRAFT_65725 [Zymoseptoria tritici IPO323]SMQ45633.1 unnamed protein product [Zymoseptoria tritici ST99CH_3D7]SMR44165.1 unnamed protein product [Zymoseptoria tritici ST99CH_3D1]
MYEKHEQDDVEKADLDTRRNTLSSISSSDSQHDEIDVDAIQRSTSRTEPGEKSVRPSTDLKRTASNVLSRVASRITTRSITNPPPPPNGGLHAWTQVACGGLVIMCTWGWVNSYGTFQSYYIRELGLSSSTVSWIGSIQNFLTFVIGAFSGRLLDAGWFVPCFAVGSLIQVLGIFCMSLSTKYWQLLLTQGIMTGIGGGIIFTPTMGLIGSYFSTRRALAVGCATLGNSIGGMIYPVIVQQLLPKVGFAWTARVLGFVNLACLGLALVYLRPRLPPRKSGPMVDLSAFKEPTYALLVAGLFMFMWPNYYTFYNITAYGTQRLNLPFTSATTLTIVLNGVGLPFRIIPPLCADRFGQFNVVVPILACFAIVQFTWLAVTSIPGLYVFTTFYGIASASFQCLIPSTMASITPEMNRFGTRLGMMFSTVSIAALTGPPLGGAIQGAMDGRWWGAQTWAGIGLALCFALMLGARVSKAGWKLGPHC